MYCPIGEKGSLANSALCGRWRATIQLRGTPKGAAMSIRGLTDLIISPEKQPSPVLEVISPGGDLMRLRLVAEEGATDDAARATTPPPALSKLLSESLSPVLITAYTAFIAVLSQVVTAPTVDDPTPDQHLAWRWAGVVALVALSAAMTAATMFPAAAKSKTRRIVPTLGVLSVTITSLAWGMGLPESPVLAAVSKADGAILVAFIGFVGLGVNALVNVWLKAVVPETT
jgi:hypothetical protein